MTASGVKLNSLLLQRAKDNYISINDWAESLYLAGYSHEDALKITEYKIKRDSFRLKWYPIDAVNNIYLNPPHIKTDNQKRAFLFKGNRHSKEEWEIKKKEYDYKCAYCGEQVELTKDHIIPVARGGNDLIENIIPSCKRCNQKKQTKTAIEFKLNNYLKYSK